MRNLPMREFQSGLCPRAGVAMAKQVQAQRQTPKSKPAEPADAPTANKQIAKLWFGK
jgi:hypothetical protein